MKKSTPAGIVLKCSLTVTAIPDARPKAAILLKWNLPTTTSAPPSRAAVPLPKTTFAAAPLKRRLLSTPAAMMTPAAVHLKHNLPSSTTMMQTAARSKWSLFLKACLRWSHLSTTMSKRVSQSIDRRKSVQRWRGQGMMRWARIRLRDWSWTVRGVSGSRLTIPPSN